MYFCDNCDTKFIITNNLKEKNKSINENHFKNIVDNALKNELKKNDLLDTTLKNIIDSKEYKQLKKNQRSKVTKQVKKLLVDVNKNKINKSVFYCNNCATVKPIEPGTCIYEKYKKSKYKNKLDNFNFCLSNIVDFTRNYKCPNKTCLTNTKNHIKEAAFRRNKESFKVEYQCKVCFWKW